MKGDIDFVEEIATAAKKDGVNRQAILWMYENLYGWVWKIRAAHDEALESIAAPSGKAVAV